MRCAFATALLSLVLALARGAAAAPCDRLDAAKRELAAGIQRATHPYDCCDETLDRCLAAKRVCRLAVRLRDEICRRLAHGHDEAKIKDALAKRARSMAPLGRRASFDLAASELAGTAGAPVQVVVYGCARCPLCSRVVPELHGLVGAAPLKGKVALYFRPYPISGHAGSTEGGLAFVAAQRLRRLWPFALKLYAEFSRFAVGKLGEWAGQVGLARPAFERELAAATTRAALIESKKEGIRNGVSSTPAIFINGRRWHGGIDRESLGDVLGEELDRVQRRSY
jgi:protein-disulfide isomerase